MSREWRTVTMMAAALLFFLGIYLWGMTSLGFHLEWSWANGRWIWVK